MPPVGRRGKWRKATSFFILGPVKAAEIAGRNPGVAFILIDDRGKVWRGGPIDEFVEEMTS